MKVRVQKVKTNDVQLARRIIAKMIPILEPQFDYIVDAAPDVVFNMYQDEMILDHIIFECLETPDQIHIDDEDVILVLANGMTQVLYTHDGFYDLLRCIEPGDLDNLDPEIQKAVDESRASYDIFIS